MKNIIFKHTNSDTDSRIHDFVTQKLSALDKYLATSTDVKTEVEFEKIASHRSGAICRVEVNIAVGGALYRAEATEQTFEAAVDVVKGQLDQELRKAHSRRTSLFRRGSRKIKEILRFGQG